ncbi:o-succinylbenzoate synthase [Pelagicoccus sp. SDUM812003]|uniref:o-succinylbenzoate synthase n=1 Tax=Pelagicoccus sp. SDUM812003 TaxID=3041267 RepID=UPI00280EB9CF|nr:o-succinylbenzoate synthase [Pelagicoccus sp. SDUM812003]MDQ8203260.1 o-succinylbenzoate synthase [Pelagicoccus sp. SDUM812003]
MYRFDYKAYRRPFAKAFANARESFATREGLLVRMEDRDGRVGFGEAAPIPSFGSESFVSALAAAQALGERVSVEQLQSRELAGCPCLRWALESAIDFLKREGDRPKLEKPWPVCGLMSDLEANEALEQRLAMHYRCLKFKIGKGSFLEERRALERVIDLAGESVQLRLDANASLTLSQARAWMEAVSELPVEFLEQPLPKGQEKEMRRLAGDFPTAIALDESVCSVDDLKRWRDEQWPGVFVVKASLSGGFEDLRQELGQGDCDCVFSSALETMVGAGAAIDFAIRNASQRRALGFGVEKLFADRNVGLALGPFLQNGDLPGIDSLERLWNQI